ncbi:MAG: hypothetical protein R3E95_24470, partial [Thiolinea sp.]
LYQQLQDFQVRPYESVPLAFLHKLARMNGWTAAYTERVFVEYKRFLFMTVAAGHFVCPCEAVDQTWHFHLLYTESYWNDLCGEILGHPLHHVPSPGGTEERQAFFRDYASTLASYERLFGVKPPADIWEQAHERLQVTPHLRLVNTHAYWLAPSPVRLLGQQDVLASIAIGFCLMALVLGDMQATEPAVAADGQEPWFFELFMRLILTLIMYGAGSVLLENSRNTWFSLLPRIIAVTGIALLPWQGDRI